MEEEEEEKVCVGMRRLPVSITTQYGLMSLSGSERDASLLDVFFFSGLCSRREAFAGETGGAGERSE